MQGLRGTVKTWMRLPRSWVAGLAFLALGGESLWATPPIDSPDCQARLEEAIAAISSHPRVKDVPPAKIKATTEFALGNSLFALLHEMGHGLISDLGLPVLGREEDAADAFATVTMLEMKTEFTHRVLVNAAKSWMIIDRRTREAGDPVVFYDAHGLDLQRAYNIICLMVGSDPDQFDDLAAEVNLPEDRRETCVVVEEGARAVHAHSRAGADEIPGHLRQGARTARHLRTSVSRSRHDGARRLPPRRPLCMAQALRHRGDGVRGVRRAMGRSGPQGGLLLRTHGRVRLALQGARRRSARIAQSAPGLSAGRAARVQIEQPAALTSHSSCPAKRR